MGSPLSIECVKPYILGNFPWAVYFLYPIGFSLDGELVILVFESYFLSFLSPIFEYQIGIRASISCGFIQDIFVVPKYFIYLLL